MTGESIYSRWIELQKQKTRANYLLDEETKKVHTEIVMQNKKTIRIIDALFVMAVIFNFGALFLTNFMVVKNSSAIQFQYSDGVTKNFPLITFYEINPIAQQLHDFTPHPQTKKLFAGFQKLMWIWAFLSTAFILARRNILSEQHITLLYCLVFVLWLVTNYDFINDLGFFTGWWMY